MPILLHVTLVLLSAYFLNNFNIYEKFLQNLTINYIWITFRLHFLHIFAILKIQNTSQKSPKHNKGKWKNGKNSGKNSTKVAKIKFYYGTDGS